MSNEAEQTTYWKSLNQLANNDEYEKFVHREFPENASELKDGVSRRTFLRIMGASIALAGFAACRRPVQKILPYSKQPEEVIPGVPLYYASAMPFQDALTGLLIENHEGRPTKIEGNKMHPASQGNSSKFNQAATLDMYDPDRSRYVRKNGERSSYTAFQSFCKQYFSDTSRNIAFISEANSSPTYHNLKKKALGTFSNAKWVTYEPFGENNALEGTNIAFGERLRTVNHFDDAEIIVALDDDFLNPAANKNSVQDRKGFANARKITSPEDNMARMYAVESTFTLTGSNADNRMRLKSSEIGQFVHALAYKLSGSASGLSGFSANNKFSDHKWINALAEDLLAHRGKSIVRIGNEHDPALHAAVAAINKALGNEGSTVTYHRVPYLEDQNNREVFSQLTQALNNKSFDAVVLIGTNPVYTAPADLNFAEALSNTENVVHLSDYYNETSKKASWHVNRAHFLEAWGDGYSFTGIRSVIQPQIRPLFEGKSELEFLNTVINGADTDGYKLIQDTWKEYYGGLGFKNKWETILHDGLDTTDTFPQVSPSIAGSFSGAMKQSSSANTDNEGIELVIRPDSKMFDGRYANNSWLQELPSPMTKITWDNVALMSQETADKFGVKAAGLGKANVEVLTLNVNGKKVDVPAWVQPGHAHDSITVTVGYGRKGIGRVADGVGVDTYPLRNSNNMLYATNINVAKAGRLYPISCTQDHSSMEGRSLLRYAKLEEYRSDPEFSSYEGAYKSELPGSELAKERGSSHLLSMFTPQADAEYPDYQPQWGMAIDLNACIGCGACTIACQAENNIPVVGKKEVSNGREMHWIRTDRYFEGDVESPNALHQPVPCMHCELAPCEQVCPVAATTHSEDGMNQMTYNRCIGTRYCLNNCPYKVRRFNFFNYSKEFLTKGDDPEVIQMAMNPDVTVRFRGVMEKCSYCVQRVNRAKIHTQIETDGSMKPPDGSVVTACQQACPSEAINFGDLTDPKSKVSKTKQNNRNYLLLEELDTRPRTSYLAKISNPNPKLA